MEALKAIDASVAGVVDKWIETMEDGENSRAASDAVIEALTNYSGSDTEAKNIVSYVLKIKTNLLKNHNGYLVVTVGL